MQEDSWIIDGNYTALYQKERLEDADKIIIVKLGRFKCLYNVIKREKTYRKNGFVNSLNAEFIWFVLFGGRTAKRRKHYKSIKEKFCNKTIVIKSKKQMDAYIKECEEKL